MKHLLLAGALLMATFTAHAIDLDQPEVRSFIDQMVSEHDFDRAALEATLSEAEVKDAILEAIARPAEKTLTWAEYRRIFITPERISAGANFWRENRDMLEEIATSTGVPEEIIVGIIGVETYYGRITGNYRVLDALSTLAFHYPPRAPFFTGEPESYLLLVREEGMDPTDATGSYAGAMGRPQFMPSSYLAYAVDSTGDGRRDIWNNWTDVAGSIANYFIAHRWRPGEDVTAQASLGGAFSGSTEYENVLTPRDTVDSLSSSGVMFVTDLSGESKAQLLNYEGEEGLEHWVGFHNFFVITRYNRNVKYALAVHQLGLEIALEVEADAG